MPFIQFVAILINVPWIIQLLEEAISVTFLCRGLPRSRKEGFLFFRDLAGLFFSLFITCFLILYLIPGLFVVTRYLSLLLIVLFYLTFCSKSSANAKRIMVFSMSSGAMCLSSISRQFGIVTTMWGTGDVWSGVVSSFLFALLIPFAIFLRKYILDDYENAIPGGGVFLIAIGSLSIFGLLCYEQAQQNILIPELLKLFIISFSGMLAMTMAGVYAIYVMCVSRREILQYQNETERLKSEKEMSAMTAAALEDMRCIRHDLRNQYSYIKLLIGEKRYEELESYCNRLSDSIPTQMQMIDCGNAFFNVLFSMWISKAKRQGIEVETKLAIPPELPFSEDDLVALISNLFENALEACEKEKRNQIRIDVVPWRDYLSIVFSNPTSATSVRRFEGGLMTTKTDLSLHGYGTRIISRVAARNNGMVDYSIEDGWFTAKVLLDRKKT